MTTLYTQQSRNVFRTWVLMSVFFILVMLVGWAISWYMQSPGILWIAVIFALTMNISAYWFSDKVALASSGAKEADSVKYLELHRILENLAITAGLPKPRLYIIEDGAPNAFAAGRDPKHAVVAVTTGLLAQLDRSELEGVLAHELSHVGNRDILVMTVAVVLAGLITVVVDMFLRVSFFGGGNRDRGGNAVLAIVAVVALILAPIAAQLIQLAISRKREFLADASGALLTRYPDGLASALQKISSYQSPMRKASHATAHLFISNPFGSLETGKFVGKLFSTHPPVVERIAALRGMKV
jgi:heat shock protein HtpX